MAYAASGSAPKSSIRLQVPSIREVAQLLGRQAEGLIIQADVDRSGTWLVQSSDGERIGRVVRTFPDGQAVTGYRGPTEALILLDAEKSIAKVVLLRSRDTHEHVEMVTEDSKFLKQFSGWKLGSLNDETFDAVSGATLTSSAMAEGIRLRMGANPTPSSLFPDPLSMDELASKRIQLIDNIEPSTIAIGDPLAKVVSDLGAERSFVRTGPLCDDVLGYQGPSELLVELDGDGKVVEVHLRNTYDNFPYVQYVKDEPSFWRSFHSLTVGQIARLDLGEAGVEGVSGATMTSMAAAETLVESAKNWPRPSPSMRYKVLQSLSQLSYADFGMLLMVGLLFPLHLTGKLRKKIFRQTYLLAVVVLIGIWSGNLLSLSLFSGWLYGGLPSQFGLPLIVLAAVALLLPPLNKSNPYCNHLCPHGALQQWVKPSRHQKMKLDPKLSWLLVRLPTFILAVAYVLVLCQVEIDLAAWEPFHAYLVRFASWPVIVFALITIMISAWVPMAYCRMGCPTGRLIDWLRRPGLNGDRWQIRDTGLVISAVVAMVVRAFVDLA